MKRIAFLPIIFSLSFIFLNVFTQAQPVMKEKSKEVINRSAMVIYAAHKYTLANKVYTGFLKQAVIHQYVAIALYYEGKYMRAIHQSRRAREYAGLQLEANNGIYPSGFEPANDELPEGPTPDRDELDAEAIASGLSATVPNDEALSKGILDDLEIKE